MEALRVLFICYWPLHDGLTRATALPHVRVLEENKRVEQILLVTIEREQNGTLDSCYHEVGKVSHVPLYPTAYSMRLVTKISDFIRFPKQLVQLVRQNRINLIVAHGAPSGALAYKVWQKTNVPFFVSLFEPHARYMLESGVWSRSGLKYIFQKHWEQKQKQHATALMPVSEAYSQVLQQEGLPLQRIRAVPCTTDLSKFNYNALQRKTIRERLGWSQALIGIYVGKFGGLYYKDEAFEIYKACFKLIPQFRLLILSSHETTEVIGYMLKHGIDEKKVIGLSVPHAEVPQYLSAADFAFATYKPGPSKRYLSPVKIGEYWASGLPVLLTEGIGDDSDIIKNEGGGALYNLAVPGSVEKAILKIQDIIKQPGHREQIRELAIKYRSPDRIKEAYDYFLGDKLDG